MSEKRGYIDITVIESDGYIIEIFASHDDLLDILAVEQFKTDIPQP